MQQNTSDPLKTGGKNMKQDSAHWQFLIATSSASVLSENGVFGNYSRRRHASLIPDHFNALVFDKQIVCSLCQSNHFQPIRHLIHRQLYMALTWRDDRIISFYFL